MKVSLKQTYSKKQNTRVKKRNTHSKKLKIRGGESEHEKAAATAKAAASAAAAKAKAEAAVTSEKAEAEAAVTSEKAEAVIAEAAAAEVPPAEAAAAEVLPEVPPVAEAVQNQEYSECDLKAQKVSNNLKQSNIKSFETGEAKKAFKFTMNEYYEKAKVTEQIEAAGRLVSAVLYTAPFVPQIVSVAKVALLGFSKLQKHKELSYLSSECLSYVANISRDVAEMNSFYLLDIVTQKGISMDEALYEILQKNLFKFLYFLIDSIDFTNTELGPQQYLSLIHISEPTRPY